MKYFQFIGWVWQKASVYTKGVAVILLLTCISFFLPINYQELLMKSVAVVVLLGILLSFLWILIRPAWEEFQKERQDLIDGK